KVDPKQRYVGVALLILAMIGGYYYFVYTAQAASLEKHKREHAKLESERAEKQAYVDNMAVYQSRMQQLQQDLDVARIQLPDDADVPALLTDLGEKAKQSGLNILLFA